MKTVKTPLLLLAMSFGFVSLGAPLARGSNNGFDRGRGFDYGEIRGVIDRTQTDLKLAADIEHGNKQRGRYQHAQDDLSKFDRKLIKGKFDKSALEHALEQLKSIVNHNTLQPSSRDALMRDMDDLRVARERR